MTQNNQQFVLNWIETLKKQGNPLADLAEDITFIIPGPDLNPIFGTFNGHKEVSQFFNNLRVKVEQQNFRVTNSLASDSEVIVFIDEEIIPKKDPKKKYLNRTAWLFRLNEDPTNQKIIYLYCYDDTQITGEALQ